MEELNVTKPNPNPNDGHARMNKTWVCEGFKPIG